MGANLFLILFIYIYLYNNIFFNNNNMAELYYFCIYFYLKMTLPSITKITTEGVIVISLIFQ